MYGLILVHLQGMGLILGCSRGLYGLSWDVFGSI